GLPKHILVFFVATEPQRPAELLWNCCTNIDEYHSPKSLLDPRAALGKITLLCSGTCSPRGYNPKLNVYIEALTRHPFEVNLSCSTATRLLYRNVLMSKKPKS
ncbi:unnamed protein product, partial [Ectocarpus sp. 13 AM-2016]